MTDSKPDADDALTGEGSSTERKPRYPRPWWIAIPRILLLCVGGTSAGIYIWVFGRAVIQHTFPTADRGLLSLLSIVEAMLLTAGGIWAGIDQVQELIAEDRRLKAERQVPYAVRAERDCRNNLAKARKKGDRRAECIALGRIGFWLNAQERFAEAEEYLMQALALARDIGDRFREVRDLGGLAECAIARGNLDEAEALYRESLAVTLELTPQGMPSLHVTDEADVIDEIAYSYALLGRFLAEQRDKRLEGQQMLAEAETRYSEEARLHEETAQAHRFGTRRLERFRLRRSLDRAEEMHALQRQYGADGG